MSKFRYLYTVISYASVSDVNGNIAWFSEIIHNETGLRICVHTYSAGNIEATMLNLMPDHDWSRMLTFRFEDIQISKFNKLSKFKKTVCLLPNFIDEKDFQIIRRLLKESKIGY